MGRLIDLTGFKYSKLDVIHRIPGISPIKYQCWCDCGNTVAVLGANLKSGNTKTCGRCPPTLGELGAVTDTV